MAFVDDSSAWTVGPSARANYSDLQAIISRAEKWEKRSGATSKGEKTTLIHFTRNADLTSTMSIDLGLDSLRYMSSSTGNLQKPSEEVCRLLVISNYSYSPMVDATR